LGERAALRMRERERGERERKVSNSIGRVSSIGSLGRTKGGVRPKPRPLANRRPHTSSGVSSLHAGKEGSPSGPHPGHHRSTRSATAPIIPPRIEIVQTVPTPPGSHSPASSLSTDDHAPSSYIQGYSFVPSSPLRRSLSESGEITEGDSSPVAAPTRPRDRLRTHHSHSQHHHTTSNGSTKSKSSISLGFGGLDSVHQIPVSYSTSNLPPLSPILSESSGTATTYNYLNHKNKSNTVSGSMSPSPNVPSSGSFTSPSTLPRPPQPRMALDRTHASANNLDFESFGSKISPPMPRASTASDRSANSLEHTGLKYGKGEKKSRFGGFKNFVQTIKGGRA